MKRFNMSKRVWVALILCFILSIIYTFGFIALFEQIDEKFKPTLLFCILAQQFGFWLMIVMASMERKVLDAFKEKKSVNNFGLLNQSGNFDISNSNIRHS